MKLEYSLTNDDFLEHHLYTASNSKLINKKRKRQRIIIPVFYIGLGLYFFSKGDNFLFALILFLFAILWFLFYPIRSKKFHIRHYKKHVEVNCKNKIDKPSIVEFREDYVFIKDYTSESKIYLAETEALIELKEHFFLRIKTGDSLIIPKRVIEKIEDFKKEIIKLNIAISDELNWEFK